MEGGDESTLSVVCKIESNENFYRISIRWITYDRESTPGLNVAIYHVTVTSYRFYAIIGPLNVAFFNFGPIGLKHGQLLSDGKDESIVNCLCPNCDPYKWEKSPNFKKKSIHVPE